jgi:hypothetical protein
LGISYEPEANLTIDPGLDAKAADVHEHREGIRDGFFEGCHPEFAWLQTIFVEPDLDITTAENLRELVRRLCVGTSVAEKYARLASSLVCRWRHGRFRGAHYRALSKLSAAMVIAKICDRNARE